MSVTVQTENGKSLKCIPSQSSTVSARGTLPQITYNPFCLLLRAFDALIP